MFDMSFPERLAQQLESRGWNYADLRRAMGNVVSVSTISRWASGEREPRLSEALSVANVFSLSLDDLADNPLKPRPELTEDEREVLKTAARLGHDRAMGRLLGIPRLGDYGPITGPR